ncbi:DEKNAAC105088 [Brettanomyces naardenensis]|uniref:DNA helicase n=1 Tax=Brettanomyces naardenensis TaxID=13370 RepID=A0A448YSM9_BRENA|nr:DEKNAAC105088 [Brettanomyces naardenensis]
MNKSLSQSFLQSLQVERQEDYQQTSELLASNSPKVLGRNGLAILNLEISNVRTSIGGKLVIELTPAQASSKKHSTDNPTIEVGDFKTGDIVRLDKSSATVQKQKKLKNSSKRKDQDDAEEEAINIDGVITSISDRRVTLAINLDSTTVKGNHLEEKIYQFYGSDIRVWLVKLSNEITYNRMESTMRKLAELTSSDTTSIMQLLLGETQFIPSNSRKIASFYNDGLNESQKKSIEFSIGNNLSIIHGPPGTGKTSTIVELVKQIVTSKRAGNQKSRVLICGPSNISVDTILERLSGFFNDSSQLVRIGHPARILPQILKHSLDLIVERDSHEVVEGIMDDIDKLTRKIKKAKNYRERRELYQEMKDLKKDLRSRTRKSFIDALLRSQVVVATLHGSSSRELVSCIRENEDLFDTLIIDEVSQALEPSCWIPLMYHRSIRKLIIAGDNKQLSPTIKTRKDKKVMKTLSTTLFDRLLKVQKNHDQFTCFLNVQYRMNEKIMRFPSDALYGGKLIADESVRDGRVKDLIAGSGDDDDDDTNEPIIWYDTEGGDFQEMDYDPGNALASSKYNDGECLVVLRHAKTLLSKGVREEDIGIITPYSAQVTKLRQLFRVGTLDDEENESHIEKPLDKIEISTVDGFQGREKEVIILSLVRSNDKRDVGFLSDEKRLNVSITRCKKQLCVVGDFETIGGSKVGFLKSWCKWCEENDVDIRYVDVSEY